MHLPKVQIDSHIHLWKLDTYKRRDWLQDKQELIKDFTPSDAAEVFDTSGVTYGIIVEAAKYSMPDNLVWLRIADESPRLIGAVTGCYLDDPDLPKMLDKFAESKSFVGVRAMPRAGSNDWHDIRPIADALGLLAARDATFEILAKPGDLDHVAVIADRFPDLTIVVDHCGMPQPDSVDSGDWTSGISAIAPYRNIFMKYSGFAMLGKGLDDSGFFGTIADTLWSTMGPGRLIAGSNWPVDSLWAKYPDAWMFGRQLLPPTITEIELQHIYAENAIKAYRLSESVDTVGVNG